MVGSFFIWREKEVVVRFAVYNEEFEFKIRRRKNYTNFNKGYDFIYIFKSITPSAMEKE